MTLHIKVHTFVGYGHIDNAEPDAGPNDEERGPSHGPDRTSLARASSSVSFVFGGMRSQFQFLQSEHDENEFVEAFAKEADAFKKESDTQWWFCIGDCRIQFLRSPRSADNIALGRIAIATHGGLESYSPKAEKLFARMRTWLKRRYVNQLTAENINFPGNSTPYRMMWLGPDARAKYRSSQVTLRSIPSGPVVIKEEPTAQAGANGRQPSASQTTQTLATAPSRCSPRR